MMPRRSLSAKTRVFDFFRSVFKIGFLERVLLAVVRGAPYGDDIALRQADRAGGPGILLRARPIQLREAQE